jgi:hypothetical protein
MNVFSYSVGTELLVLRATIPILLLIISWFVGRAWFKRQVKPGVACPKCGKTSFHRVHRTFLDRLLGVNLPARRYRCDNSLCGWTGLRERQFTSHHSHD